MVKLGCVLGWLLVLLPTFVAGLAISEDDRMVEYAKRNYTWPVPVEKYVPPTEGWKRLFDHRFRQIEEIEARQQRYEGFLQTAQAAYIAPNFTQYGFGLARAPESLMKDLRDAIRTAVANQDFSEEEEVEVIEAKDQPWFVKRPDLTRRVLEELQDYPQTWAGMELTPYLAYGFRLYRNESKLFMHVDKPQTHIISFILHIDSSDDSDPWPILIEDFDGNTHEVILTSGDMLFYESSKCFHGRPHTFKGSWYSSVFVHYYPKYGWDDVDHSVERHYGVPGHWHQPPSKTQKLEIPIEMKGTSMTEPTCPNGWCSSEHTIKWSGPGEEGYWIAPTQEKFKFEPQQHPTTATSKDNTKERCTDDFEECTKWITWTTNECKRNPTYMTKHCRKSCGICSVF